MFWKTLDQGRINVLKKITADMPLEGSYLAGGTGLALQIGHRKSFDFDWFSPTGFNPEEVQRHLEELGKLKDVKLAKGTFHGTLDNVRVTWLYYPNPLIRSLHDTKKMPGLKIASVEDIALMKMIAISSRGAKRDFIDLYYILQKGITLQELLRHLPDKFPRSEINKYHIIKSLTFYDDAEKDVIDDNNIPWSKIKQYFKDIQPRLIEQNMGDK